MAIVTKPHGDFVNNVDVANAAYVDDQFNTLYNLVNGNLDSTNVKSAAAVQGVTNPWGDNTTASRSGVDLGSGALTMTSAGTFYKLPFNAKFGDNLSEYDTTTMKFTAKYAGRYRISLAAMLAAPPAGTRLYGIIYKNATNAGFIADGYNSSAATDLGIHGGTEITLAAGDYLEFYLGSSSANVTINTNANYTNASITKIA